MNNTLRLSSSKREYKFLASQYLANKFCCILSLFVYDVRGTGSCRASASVKSLIICLARDSSILILSGLSLVATQWGT